MTFIVRFRARTHRSTGEQPALDIWRRWLPTSRSAPRRNGTLIRFWCCSETELMVGY
jgi:hypothetical protein